MRDWVGERSPAALAAGGLGVVAPVDGIFILPAAAAIVCGFIGWSHLNRRRDLKGHRLCALGVIGGVVGLLFAAFLHTWDRNDADASLNAPTGVVSSDTEAVSPPRP